MTQPTQLAESRDRVSIRGIHANDGDHKLTIQEKMNPKACVLCPSCGEEKSNIVDSRPATFMGSPSRRRRRSCGDCRTRFTTYEVVAETDEEFLEDARREAIISVLSSMVGDYKIKELKDMLAEAIK